MSKAWPVDGIEPHGSLAENARRILAVRMAEFFSYAPIVDREEAMVELHNLRIAAKRLRYTLELFRAVFSETGERQIDNVKALQTELGEIHDHDVRLALIDYELDRLDRPTDPPREDDPIVGLLALRARQVAARHDHYLAFHALWQQTLRDGMRAGLAALSSRPLPPAPAG